jgi:uncharacterized protein (TIGR02246 family)
MKRKNYLKLIPVCIVLSCLTIGCNSSTADKVDKETAIAEQMPAKPDMAKLKTEIQALESAWAAADNARDTNAVAAFYADDAISLANNKPMLVGKAAIRQDIAESLAKRGEGARVTYDVVDVFGDENAVTEIGTSTVRDASGKMIRTGKYMAVWQKRDGKYICVRDIYNDDVKEE